MRWATAMASDSSSTSQSTASSSPPMRATVSSGRVTLLTRSQRATNKRSPTWWPRLSLITLKRSTSR